MRTRTGSFIYGAQFDLDYVIPKKYVFWETKPLKHFAIAVADF